MTKTRLCPPLSPEQAAELYRAFLQDTLCMALSLGWERVSLVYPDVPGAGCELRAIVPAGVCLRPQSGRGLGDALAGAFQSHVAEGFGQVVLIGSDNPTLPASVVETGRRGLSDHDVVIGPSADGGYYLIGMERPHPGIFERISWSTEVVYEETIERARQLGLSVLSLQEWYDVDTAADLQRLQDELTLLPPDVAPATRTALARLMAPPGTPWQPDRA